MTEHEALLVAIEELSTKLDDLFWFGNVRRYTYTPEEYRRLNEARSVLRRMRARLPNGSGGGQ
jgi:hypothetical protein